MKSVLGKYARVTRGIDMNIEIVNIVMNGDEKTLFDLWLRKSCRVGL